MGYSYGINRYSGRQALACDFCSRCDGSVKKKACPYGYCKPSAYCSQCWGKVDKNERKHRHESCRVANIEYEKHESDKASILLTGDYLNVYNSSEDNGVLMGFRNKNNHCREFIVDNKLYGELRKAFKDVKLSDLKRAYKDGLESQERPVKQSCNAMGIRHDSKRRGEIRLIFNLYEGEDYLKACEEHNVKPIVEFKPIFPDKTEVLV